MLTKWEIGAGVVVAALLLNSKKGNAATAPAKGKPEDDLLRRAHQARAAEWVPILVYDLGVPQSQAEAISRWFGIESSGDPLTVSKSGERGLAQITKTSALTEKALTPDEWAAIQNVTTSLQEHARIALKVIAWCYDRAVKYIKVPPIDPIEHLWYAKLYHEEPVLVRDGKLTGDAHADALRLEGVYAGNAKSLRYLHAANVVAWDSLQPPTAGGNS
jgi:hypothetical protein